MYHAVASFDIENWDEHPAEIPTLVQATVRGSYTGDITGSGIWMMVMHYGAEGAAHGVWLERVTGRLGDRDGSFVLRHTGHFAEATATVTFEVVPGSGTGELANLHGHGGYTAAQGRTISKIVLDYEFAE